MIFLFVFSLMCTLFFTTLLGNHIRYQAEVLGQLQNFDMYSFVYKSIWGIICVEINTISFAVSILRDAEPAAGGRVRRDGPEPTGDNDQRAGGDRVYQRLYRERSAAEERGGLRKEPVWGAFEGRRLGEGEVLKRRADLGCGVDSFGSAVIAIPDMTFDSGSRLCRCK